MLDFDLSFKTTIKLDRIDKMVNDIVAMSSKKVSVGVPTENDNRKDEEGNKEPIGNAAIAIIQDQGSELQNIPPRPFLDVGIKKVFDRINTHFLKAAKEQLNNNPDQVSLSLHRAGTIARDSVKKTIDEGDFVPLERSTLLARTRKRKYAWKTKEQREEIMESMQPLVDTGSLRNSIEYVVIDKDKREVGEQ